MRYQITGDFCRVFFVVTQHAVEEGHWHWRRPRRAATVRAAHASQTPCRPPHGVVLKLLVLSVFSARLRKLRALRERRTAADADAKRPERGGKCHPPCHHMPDCDDRAAPQMIHSARCQRSFCVALWCLCAPFCAICGVSCSAFPVIHTMAIMYRPQKQRKQPRLNEQCKRQ